MDLYHPRSPSYGQSTTYDACTRQADSYLLYQEEDLLHTGHCLGSRCCSLGGSARAATLLDLIRHQADVGGIESIAHVAKDFSSQLDIRDLTLALDATNQSPVAQRLGFILDHLNLTLPAQKVEGWLRSRRITLQPLVLGDREDGHPFKSTPSGVFVAIPRLLDLFSEIT